MTDPVRKAQFENDLRLVTDSLIARHKNTSATKPAQRFWFWGRTLGFGDFDALQTDFGHNIKSYEMIYNANNVFADHPWQSLDADRDRLLQRAWDDPAARWNQRIGNFVAGNVVPDSEWWIHDEADQLLAAMDLHDGFDNQDRWTSWPAVPSRSSTCSSTATCSTRPARPSHGSPGTPTTPTFASRSSARTCSTTTSTR